MIENTVRLVSYEVSLNEGLLKAYRYQAMNFCGAAKGFVARNIDLCYLIKKVAFVNRYEDRYEDVRLLRDGLSLTRLFSLGTPLCCLLATR